MNISATTSFNRPVRALPGKAACIRRLREAMAEGRFNPASEKFRCVLRILRRSARNKWKPTPPQIENMQRIVGELDEDESLIDWGDTGETLKPEGIEQ